MKHLNVKKKLKIICFEYIMFNINTRMGNEGVSNRRFRPREKDIGRQNEDLT